MELDSENLNPNTELRKLHLSHLNELVTILESGESWKKLMAIIPKKLSEDGYESNITLHNKAKFTTSDFTTILETSERYHKKPTEILFQEWGTMGPRPRVNLGHLKYLLVKAELLAAANYLAMLLREAPPERPAVGPGAAITIPIEFETENVITNMVDNPDHNEDVEVERQLDEIGYVQQAVEQIRRRSQEIHQHQIEPVVPDIVITEDQPAPQPIQIPMVIQRPRASTPPSNRSKRSPNPVDIIDTNPQEDYDDFSTTSGNIPNLDYLIQQHVHPISPPTSGEPSREESSSSNTEVGSNSDSANFSMPSGDNIPALHIIDNVLQRAAQERKENQTVSNNRNLPSGEMMFNSMYNSESYVQDVSEPVIPLFLQEQKESTELNDSEKMVNNSMYNSMLGTANYSVTVQSDMVPLVVQQYHNNLGSKQVNNTQSKISSEEVKSNSLYISTTDMQASENLKPQEEYSSNISEYSVPLVVQNYFESDVKSDSHVAIDCTDLANISINSSLPHYNYEVLKNATNGFSRQPEVYLGSGGFGSVYLAKGLSNQPLAVKKLNIMLSTNLNLRREFKREVENMHRYDHPNLVSLLGYSCDTENYCLVFEFVSGGSLFDVLRNKPESLLWVERVKIALGTARGVAHLHTAFDPPMVHRDVKSTNILFSANGNVKVCDYGISKLLPNGVTLIDDSPCGTIAYMPTEYTTGKKVSLKMDSFSFGVVLLELLTSLPPLDSDRDDGVDLVSYAEYKCKESNSVEPILDRSVGKWEHNGIDFSTELYNLVVKCLDEKENRPLMTEIVISLEKLVECLK
ncbi:serine/threonine-protein kinase pelle-like [Anthonomus grandis grandis]|uniref:serine/threonine-protein kinase pelle-like n=1 Tax=Anthonomus grandis grandis TaxID=2921223 RepID=UPI00216593B0|nr:serine/threonine-protein kinase pelle-like [Anthonomus grandis grandis]